MSILPPSPPPPPPSSAYFYHYPVPIELVGKDISQEATIFLGKMRGIK